MTVALDHVKELYAKPLLDLVFEAASIQRDNHLAGEVQLCTLLSIKTGGCTEDCKYCSQSIDNQTVLQKESLLDVDAVLADAQRARASGSTRFFNASPCQVSAISAPAARQALAMPQAIERLLATPRITPRLPCIRPEFGDIRFPID